MSGEAAENKYRQSNGTVPSFRPLHCYVGQSVGQLGSWALASFWVLGHFLCLARRPAYNETDSMRESFRRTIATMYFERLECVGFFV